MSGEFFGLFRDLWGDLQDPDVWWQVGALLVSLAVAVVAARLLHRRRRPTEGSALQIGLSGVNRMVFPATALLLVLLARALLRPWAHVNLLNVAVPLLASLAMVRVGLYAVRQAFAPSGWLAASERFIAIAVWGGVALHITGVAPYLIDLLEAVSFRIGKQELNLWMLLHGAFTVGVTVLVALWVAGSLEARLMRLHDIDANVRVVIGRLARAVLTVVAVLVALALVGIDVTALSVFGGALAVGLGFGLQKIASNYVSGFIILLDRSIRIGDLISVDPHVSGTVTQITTRYTVLRTVTGTEAIVPNEYLVSNTVLNQSYTDSRVRMSIPVQVAYGTDLDRALELLCESAARQPRVLMDPAPQALVLGFGESGIDLELGLWIGDPQQGTAPVRSAVNLDIWRTFREHGIEIPFPQREVRILGNPAMGGVGPRGQE